METITGKIESIETTAGESGKGIHWERGSFKINGKSYSTFDVKVIEGYKSGDSIELEFEPSPDGRFKNIKTIKKVETQEQFQPASEMPSKAEKEVDENVWLAKDRRISRMATINASVEMIKALNEIEPEKAKELLKKDRIIDLVMNSSEALEDFVWRP